MIKYFQLTPEILLEYVYENEPKLAKGNVKDICNEYPTMLLTSNAFGSKYLCFKNESEGLDSFSNLVLPLNNTETQFVIAKNVYQNYFYSKNNISNMFFTKNGSEYIYEDTNYDKDIISKGKSCDVTYDKCIVHFTSRNYFGSYDALIFQAYVYMTNKAKMYFASFLFKKTSNLEMKNEHLLYNEKLYTKHIEFDIPSVFAILDINSNSDSDSDRNDVEFNKALELQNINLMKNTPVGISVYGVSGTTKGTDNYVRLKTYKINNITIPYIYNRFDEIQIDISEAPDGDFYYIDPKIGLKEGDEKKTFVDYIEKMGEDIRAYVVMHELKLQENWIDDQGKHSVITHKESHIIDIDEYDEDEVINNRFDAKIKYRPICTQSGLEYQATIIDTLKIINTVDSSSYEVTGSLTIANPHKYGKKLQRLNISNDNRPIVNVYNKKVSDENGVILNGVGSVIGGNRFGSNIGFTIENMSQNITSFIESTNIGVSIVELSPGDIN